MCPARITPRQLAAGGQVSYSRAFVHLVWHARNSTCWARGVSQQLQTVHVRAGAAGGGGTSGRRGGSGTRRRGGGGGGGGGGCGSCCPRTSSACRATLELASPRRGVSASNRRCPYTPPPFPPTCCATNTASPRAPARRGQAQTKKFNLDWGIVTDKLGSADDVSSLPAPFPSPATPTRRRSAACDTTQERPDTSTRAAGAGGNRAVGGRHSPAPDRVGGAGGAPASSTSSTFRWRASGRTDSTSRSNSPRVGAVARRAQMMRLPARPGGGGGGKRWAPGPEDTGSRTAAALGAAGAASCGRHGHKKCPWEAHW